MKRILRKEEGFTLIDVIVTIAIVIALAVGGFVSYGNLTDQAKRAVTEAAAQQVYDAANVFNHEKSKTPTEASAEFNQRHEKVTTSVVGENCVVALHEDGQSAKRGDGCGSVIPPGGGGGPIIGGPTCDLASDPDGEEFHGWDVSFPAASYPVGTPVFIEVKDARTGEILKSTDCGPDFTTIEEDAEVTQSPMSRTAKAADRTEYLVTLSFGDSGIEPMTHTYTHAGSHFDVEWQMRTFSEYVWPAYRG
ncbi:hypothetical protein GCM10009847_10740 [Leucobacter tardus]|uniref:Type II secretion system protein n=1 Tax=Leucobacter tardus TaxID=501483 RepID=A0A939QJW6_9MICO|nr:type II secretion system protein [Leucobacter tardus]MBO2989271.1 type II secretion system protein [Leucobacter tardus]